MCAISHGMPDPPTPKPRITAVVFAEAYRKGFPITFRFLRSLGIEESRAEEIAQAAWARGWEKRGSVERNDRLIPWINTIALNLFRSWFRRTRRDGEMPKTLSISPAKHAMKVDLEKGLDVCAPHEQELLRERYVEGYSSLEVAGRRNMNPVTVRVQLMRAKRKVRRFLEGGGFKPAATAV